MAEHLQVKVTGKGEAALVLLHGLFGSGNNLGQLARAFGEDFRVYCVDLPDHGRSAWLPLATVTEYARVVAAWLDAENLENVSLLGHSLGGKVAMQVAFDHGHRVKNLVMLDIAPLTYPRGHDAIFRALRDVKAERLATRREVRELLATHLEASAVIEFLLLSAYTNEIGAMDWRFNVSGLEAGYLNLLQAVSPATQGVNGYRGPALMLRGAQSNYVPDDAKEQFSHLFSSLTVLTVERAGHWLHQEQTDAVVTAIRRFLEI